MKIRITVILLLAALLLASCGEGGAGKETDTAAPPPSGTAATAAPDTETEPAETGPVPDIPDVKYDGESFRVMYRFGTTSYNCTDVWADTITGDVVGDAVYNRNIKLEDHFGIKLVPLPDTSPYDKMKKNVAAYDDWCEVLSDQKRTIFPLTLDDYMQDWNAIEYVDFENPWWDSNFARDMSLGEHLYMAVGDFNFFGTTTIYFLAFNKKLVTDYNLALPYQDVYDGTWTFDKMCDMVKQVSEDLDGDGKMTTYDRWGIMYQTEVAFRMTAGMGVRMTVRDEDNYPVLAPLDDRMIDAIEKVIELRDDETHAISYRAMWTGQNTAGYPHEYAFARSRFVTDQLLFLEGTPTMCINEFGDMGSPFGVCPMPKYDEEQDRYYALSDEFACAWVIPVTSQKSEMTGILTEYWAYLSQPLMDAVYKKMLKGRRMDAPDDAAMLDIIFDSAYYEISFLGPSVGISDMMQRAVSSGNVASAYAAAEESIEKKLDSFRTE